MTGVTGWHHPDDTTQTASPRRLHRTALPRWRNGSDRNLTFSGPTLSPSRGIHESRSSGHGAGVGPFVARWTAPAPLAYADSLRSVEPGAGPSARSTVGQIDGSIVAADGREQIHARTVVGQQSSKHSRRPATREASAGSWGGKQGPPLLCDRHRDRPLSASGKCSNIRDHRPTVGIRCRAHKGQ